MLSSLRQIADWAENRTGFGLIAKQFLLEQIPASAGWAQVFGSVTLFLFVVQIFTGILLALNFAPTPAEGYQSLRYIIHQISAGRLLHGLHHWGSSLLIIAAVVHMCQVFLYCAYRKPREVTWIIGCLLLLLILAFGLTGYLLPWDNKAYWGTVVTTRMIRSAPLAGPWLSRLAGAEDGVGAVTYSRFYAAHTILLPSATLFLVFVHLYLVRRHGVAGGTTVANGEEKVQTFYPKQVFRDLLAICLSFILLFLAAALLEVPLERFADPADLEYIPRPEWYFLFLFEALRLFSGSLEWIATIILPSAAVLLLFCVPFLPTRWRLDRKLLATAVIVFAASGWAGLTLAAYKVSPHRLVKEPAEAIEWSQIAPEEIAGMGYFQTLRCGSCHNLLDGPPKAGPNLASSDLHHPRQWLAQHFAEPDENAPQSGTERTGRLGPVVRDESVERTGRLGSVVRDKSVTLSRPELNALSLFVENLKPESVPLLRAMSGQYIRGAQVYVTSACNSCHKVNGAGGGIGPALNGLAERRTREWTKAHFLQPAKLSPHSVMPPYRFSPADEDAILLYLHSLSD